MPDITFPRFDAAHDTFRALKAKGVSVEFLVNETADDARYIVRVTTDSWQSEVGGGETATFIHHGANVLVVAFDIIGTYRDEDHFWCDATLDAPLSLTPIGETERA